MARSPFLERESSNRTRRHVGIPIPSFASATGASGTGASATSTQSTTQSAATTVTTTVDTLVQLEVALSTFCATRKRTTLTLQEFTHVTKPMPPAAAASMHNITATSMHTNNSKDQQLSRDEALLLDLLSCTSPTLYKFEQENNNDKWRLHIVEFKGNRIQELRKLVAATTTVQQQQQLDEKRNTIRLQLQQYKQQQQQQQQEKKQLQNNKKYPVAPHKIQFSMETLLPAPAVKKTAAATTKAATTTAAAATTTTTTLEERVAARAQAKVSLQQEISHQSSSADIIARLRLADALWSHSRHILLRQSRFLKRSPMPPCVMTMKDIVNLVKGSRKQVVEAMKDLQQCVPEWIVFSPTNVTKQTTVWIHPLVEQYQQIRTTKLGGTAVQNNSTTTTTTTGNTLKRKATTAVAVQNPTTGSLKRKAAPSNTTATTTIDRQQAIPSDVSARALATKKDTTTTTSGGTNDSSTRIPVVTGKKRSSAVDDDDILPVRKKKRSHAVLRINHHLILTDADYDGGEVIALTSTMSSPRGLKGMFSQMNAGRRI